jgi:hypothetical protein
MDVIAFLSLTAGLVLIALGGVGPLLIPDVPRHRVLWAILTGTAAALFGLSRLPQLGGQGWMRLASIACLVAAALTQWRGLQQMKEERERELEEKMR